MSKNSSDKDPYSVSYKNTEKFNIGAYDELSFMSVFFLNVLKKKYPLEYLKNIVGTFFINNLFSLVFSTYFICTMHL